MITIIIILTLIIIIAIFSMLIISYNHRLTYLNYKVNKAQKEIEEELDNRYKIVKDIQKTIVKSTKMELKIYKDLDDLKEKHTISSIEYDRLLNELIEMIYLIQNDYPKITKKKDFKETISKIDESNTKIIAVKSFYNENNKEMIELLKKFPTNILGKIKQIEILPNYEVEKIEDEY